MVSVERASSAYQLDHENKHVFKLFDIEMTLTLSSIYTHLHFCLKWNQSEFWSATAVQGLGSFSCMDVLSQLAVNQIQDPSSGSILVTEYNISGYKPSIAIDLYWNDVKFVSQMYQMCVIDDGWSGPTSVYTVIKLEIHISCYAHTSMSDILGNRNHRHNVTRFCTHGLQAQIRP